MSIPSRLSRIEKSVAESKVASSSSWDLTRLTLDELRRLREIHVKVLDESANLTPEEIADLGELRIKCGAGGEII